MLQKTVQRLKKYKATDLLLSFFLMSLEWRIRPESVKGQALKMLPRRFSVSSNPVARISSPSSPGRNSQGDGPGSIQHNPLRGTCPSRPKAVWGVYRLQQE